MFKTWFFYATALIAAFVFFLVYKMWASWYILMLLLLVPVADFIMCRVSSEHLEFTSEVPSMINIGDKAALRIKVDGLGASLALVNFTATVTDKMTDTRSIVKYSVFDKGTTKIDIDTSHCGAFTYKITELKIYDLFGFFYVSCSADRTHEVFIRPVPCMPHFMPNSMGIRARLLRKSNQPGAEIYDIRDYTQGDPVKTIHWKMSAKKDKLIVKEPLEEYAGHSRVLLKLTPDRGEMDVHLGEMLFTSTYFIKHDITHKIRIIPPSKCEVGFEIENDRDLERAILAILRMKLPKEEQHAH